MLERKGFVEQRLENILKHSYNLPGRIPGKLSLNEFDISSKAGATKHA